MSKVQAEGSVRVAVNIRRAWCNVRGPSNIYNEFQDSVSQQSGGSLTSVKSEIARPATASSDMLVSTPQVFLQRTLLCMHLDQACYQWSPILSQPGGLLQILGFFPRRSLPFT
jgi:hypothetical protein